MFWLKFIPVCKRVFLIIYFIILQSDFVVDTSLVGCVLNGLSHLHNVRNKAHFAVCLIHGLGGNLNEGSREEFAKEVS